MNRRYFANHSSQLRNNHFNVLRLNDTGGPPGIGINPRGMNPPRGPSLGAPMPAGYAPGMRGPPPGMYTQCSELSIASL